MTTEPTEIQSLLDAALKAEGTARDVLFRTAQVLSLRQAITNCTRCPLHTTATAPVPWEGGPVEIAIIGEAPGADEDRRGRPFVGRAGTLLTSLLHTANLERHQVAFINTICCRPPGNDYAKADEADAPVQCAPWLQAQIEITGAWLLVPVGNQALHQLLPQITAKISSARGRPIWHGRHLHLPTFHPSYALRNPEARGVLQEDLIRASRILTGILEAPVPKNYDPTALISSLRRPEQLAMLPDPWTGQSISTHFANKGWIRAYSHWLGDNIICVRDEKTIVPQKVTGVRYTVRELVQLSHYDRSWETARRIHYTKKSFGATIV